MESDRQLRERLLLAERAAAAPYVDYPRDPWWIAPGFGLLAVLFVLGINLRERPDGSGWLGSLMSLAVVLAAGGFLRWQRRRRGTMPAGKAPREVKRVLVGFVVGASIVAVALFTLADTAPLWLALPAAFAVTTAGMLWYGAAYDHAAAKVKERLA